MAAATRAAKFFMRLLRCRVLRRMARACRDVAEVQTSQQFAHRPLVHVHAECGRNLVTQVDQPPAHDLVAIGIRPLAHPLGHPLFLLGRQLPGRRARVGTVLQTGEAICIVAVHPIAQRLPVHPGAARRLGPALAFHHQSQRQCTPRLRAVTAARRRLAQVRRREIGPRNRNRHVQVSLPEQVLNRMSPRRSKSQASQHVGRVV